jgi:hypothetical protein
MKFLRQSLVACVVASSGSLVQAQSGVWQVEQVQEEQASDCSIEVDAQGVPHVGFRAYGAQTHLKYGQRVATGWSVETVDGTPTAGQDVSLRLDSGGQPHIAYADTEWLAPGVKLADRAGSSWLLQVVTSQFGVRTSLALSASDSPVIAYANYYDNMTLYLASLRAGQWFNRKLTNNTVGGLSLALDAGGHPHIAYVDAVAGTLKYARFTGVSWQFETIEPVTVEHYARAVSLALGADGRAFIAYDAGNELRFASKRDGIWRTEAIDGSASASVDYVSLRLDGGDDPHVAYAVRLGQGALSAALRYARRPSFGLPIWNIETVDNAYAILGVSLDLDAGGAAHIAYVWDNALFLLKYATNKP